MGNQRAVLAFVVLGVANHLFFKRYEPVRTTVIRTVILLLVQPLLVLFTLNHYSIAPFSLYNVVIGYMVFLSSLTTSIILYRVSPFHPLAKVPGPTIFKVSKLWHAYITWRGDQHLVLKELHDRYGPIVRKGPNEVSVIDADSVQAVLGTDGLPKGHSYLSGSVEGHPSPLIVLNGQERNDRRRIWRRGFTSESIKEYQPVIEKRVVQLADSLHARSKSGSVDLLKWFNFFSFGTPSDMLKEENDHGVFETLQRGLIFNEIGAQIPWITHVWYLLPSLGHHGLQMFALANTWCGRRLQKGPDFKDVWYHLTDEAGNEKVKPTVEVVASDSVLAMVAGSDTTSTSIANVFWCLLSHPECYKKLRAEVDREYPPGTDPLLDTARHGNLKYLNACLNEALRLLPPVPSNGSRVVPKGSGGKIISGHYIPEGTQVYVPHYSVHRNPENFSPSPDEFIPERWLSDSESGDVNRADAFIPFSVGPMNCVGKNVARLEMVMVLITLIQRFEFEFAKGFDWKGWPDRKRDAFVSLSGPLQVGIRSRY
ncbi:cytochrome P450 [Marasmius fiardii PR-910]|nr:cytochrome P450 [Marasmius fiardii PR-910]